MKETKNKVLSQPVKADEIEWRVQFSKAFKQGIEAYAGVKPRNLIFSLAEILESPITSWKEKLTNDFEESVFEIHPQINKIKDELYRQGALYANMSGSGAAVFGIFNTPVSLKNNFDGDYWAGVLK